MANLADGHVGDLRVAGPVEEAKEASMNLLQGLIDKAPLHNNEFFSGNDSVIDFNFTGLVNQTVSSGEARAWVNYLPWGSLQLASTFIQEIERSSINVTSLIFLWSRGE